MLIVAWLTCVREDAHVLPAGAGGEQLAGDVLPVLLAVVVLAVLLLVVLALVALQAEGGCGAHGGYE